MKKWFISYICVLIVPFVLGCLLYAYSQESVQSEVDTIQELNIQNIQTMVEDAVQNARNISEALLCDEKVALLMNLPEGAGYSEAGLIQEITEMIQHYETANHLFSSIYICMAEREYVLTESACYRYDWISSVSEEFFGINYELFCHLMEEENYHHFLLTENGEECEGIYVHSSWRYQEKKAPVVILIRYHKELLRETLASGEYLTCLFDSKKDGFLFAGQWPEQSETLLQEVLAGENQDYYLLERELAGTGIQVINLIEKDLYLSPIKRMQCTLFVYVFVCILAGGFLAWYMARRQYFPVRELADIAEQMERHFYGGSGEGDEFSRIRASMERLASSYAEQKNLANEHKSIASSYKSIAGNYKTIARKNEQYAKEMLLARFLQERSFGRQELFQAYELLNTLFGRQKILLLAYEAEDQEEQETDSAAGEYLKRTEEEQSLADRLELPFFVLKNITEELAAGHYASFCLECSGMLLCLFGIPKEAEEQALLDIRRVSEQVCVYAGEYFHYTIVANISALHENGQDAILAYQEVMELVSFRDRIGSPLPVIVYTEFCQDADTEGAEHYRQIQKLQQMIWEQQFLEAAELLKKMGAEPKKDTLDLEVQAEQKEPENHIDPEKRMQEVAAYIDSHYKDKNLTVGFLADMLGLGLSNLSQMFKRYQHCGLLDYINQVRLEQAKLLLLEGKTVKETADLVGFYTTRPLTNLFNQLEGMTPMKWKNQRLKKTQEKE